ncbi:transposase, partial [Mycobacterium canetti]|uniref:transposase n=1 Tax=Mycobacterium canetti TaxID=78331 RepID=UPI00399D73B2
MTAFCRLDELGVEVTGQHLDSERAVLACRITDEDRWCRRCGEQGQVRDTVTRRLAHWCTILVSVILDGLPDAPEAPLGYRPARLTAVMSIMSFAESVDEHVWRHTRRGDKYVTVIIDLTGIREGTGPARLLDMVEGRSKQAFKTWLAEREESWRQAVEVVAMDGFTGFKTATSE